MSASTSAAAELDSLFPGEIERKPVLRTVPSHDGRGGRGRALPGTRKSKTTTFTLTDLVENVLEQLTRGEYGGSHSNSATIHRALIEAGVANLGEAEMRRLGWTPSAEETPSA